MSWVWTLQVQTVEVGMKLCMICWIACIQLNSSDLFLMCSLTIFSFLLSSFCSYKKKTKKTHQNSNPRKITFTTDLMPQFVLETAYLTLKPYRSPSASPPQLSAYWNAEFALLGRISLLKYEHRATTEYGAVNIMPVIIYSVHFTVFFTFWIDPLPYVNTMVFVFVFYSVLRNKLPFEDFDGDKFSTFPVSKAFPLVQ